MRLEGLTATLGARLREEWAAFVTPECVEPFLQISVSYSEDRATPGAFAPKSMKLDLEADSARFGMAEGRAELRATGPASVRLERCDADRQYFTLLNFLRACLAWRLPSRGGALLHAAGLVIAGRAFVLVGAEGSGKSTWAALGERAGARVLSDDLVLIDGVGGRVEVLGTPFRSTHLARYGRGRWGLAAVLFPVHGSSAQCSPTAGLRVKARLAANLPFVAEGLERDPRIGAWIDGLCASVRCFDLTFARDTSFVELLEQLPSSGLQ